MLNISQKEFEAVISSQMFPVDSAICCFISTAAHHSEGFVTARLSASGHSAHVNVVVGEDLFAFVYGGLRQGPRPAQDPGEVNVEQSEDVGAGIHQGRVDIVGGQDPVGRVWQD